MYARDSRTRPKGSNFAQTTPLARNRGKKDPVDPLFEVPHHTIY